MPRPSRRRAVAAGAAIVVAVLAGAVAFAVTRGDGEVGASGTGDGPTSDHPNIVFILTDDQDYPSVEDPSLGVMPYVNSRDDWIRFTNAFQEVSLCCPSRATILSGQYSSHTGVEDNTDGSRFDDSATLATWLQGAGYRTGLIGKYLNLYPWDRGDAVPPGWDDWRVFTGDDEDSGSEVGYFDYSLDENGSIVHYGHEDADYATDVEARQAVDFIQTSDSPFFLMVAPKAPHGPWTPPSRYASTPFDIPHAPNFDESDVSDKPEWIQRITHINENLQDRRRLDAYRTVRAVDDLVHDVFDALDAKGVLDDTVVVFMTDNGFAFGEHRWTTKRCPYDECIRSPMLVRYPGQAGRVVDALAQNVDMAATFADLAGVTPSLPQDGHSLVPVITGDAAGVRDALLLHWAGGDGNGGGSPSGNAYIPAYWGVRTATAKYIEYDDGERELYDLSEDPYELVNRAGEPTYASLQADLAAKLADLESAGR